MAKPETSEPQPAPEAAAPRKAVAFDIGGVLALTPDTGWRGAWEARLGLSAGALNTLLAGVWRQGSIGQISEAASDRATADLLGLSADQLAAFLADVWHAYLGTPNAELIAYLAGLRARCRVGIISNSYVGAREREHARYGFADLVDVLVYSHEVGLQKPDARIFTLACERLGVRPAEVLFVDDVAMHVEAARALGMKAVRFEGSAPAIAAIEAHLAASPAT